MRRLVDVNYPGRPVDRGDLWMVECQECGEYRFACGTGKKGQWFRLNPHRLHNHTCHKAQYWDYAPATWFCPVLIDGEVINPWL